MGLVVVALVPSIGWLLAQGLARHRQDRLALEEQALNVARLTAHAQERRIEGARQLLVALSSHPAIRSGDREACVAAVRALVRDYDGLYTEIGWADEAGFVACHAQPAPPGMSIDDREYFRRAIRTGTFSVGELMHGRVTGALALAFVHPLTDGSGRVTGVVFANIDIRQLSASLAEETGRLGETIAIMDRTGRIVAHSHEADRLVGSEGARGQVRAMAAAGEALAYRPRADGTQWLFAISTVRDRAGEPIFFVVLGLPAERLLAGLDARFRFDLLTILLFGAGMMVAAWFGAELLVRRPIGRLVDATTALAAGRLETRAAGVGGAQEIQALAQSFNEMAERLQKRDVHLREGQRLEALGRLAGGIAHDFNNLLTVVLGYSHSLGEHLDPESEAARDLDELHTAAERATELTRQLLAFSRSQKLQPRAVLLNDTVTRMESMLRRTLGGTVTLETALDPAAGTVRADPAQMEQVILNLVINARDAMPDGGIVRLRTRNVHLAIDDEELPAGEYVELSVSDTGVGMDEATRSRVFEPFFTTKGPGGTGLGLATVYGIVMQSGGHIACDSAPGRGASFRIWLPRTHEAVSSMGTRHAGAPRGGVERILLVEDEGAVRDLVAMVLRHRGYQVLEASDGPSALARAQAGEAFDLLITDVRMPGMTGPALYAQLLQHRPDLPAVMMSGDSLPPPDAAATALQAFLQKPFTPDALLHAVRSLLDRQDRPHRRMA
jgi:two-component system cell cycle sensor histidine kinase/response regulator CckA